VLPRHPTIFTTFGMKMEKYKELFRSWENKPNSLRMVENNGNEKTLEDD